MKQVTVTDNLVIRGLVREGRGQQKQATVTYACRGQVKQATATDTCDPRNCQKQAKQATVTDAWRG